MASDEPRETLEGPGAVDDFFEAMKAELGESADRDPDALLSSDSSEFANASEELPENPEDGPSREPYSLDFDDASEKGQEDGDPSSIELDPTFTYGFSEPSAADAVSDPEPGEDPEPDVEREDGESPGKRPVYFRKIVILSCVVAALLVLGTVSLLLWKSKGAKKPNRQVLLTTNVVRHPLPIPIHTQSLEFLFLSASQERKDLLSLGIELEVEGNESHEFYANNEVFFRETIYTFLLRQKPSQNTYRSWQDILEKTLPEHLASSLPQCRIRSLTILKLERL